MPDEPGPILRSLSDIRHHFLKNTVPTYYIDETSLHLLGIDEWVRNFRYITYSDPFDGAHPNIFTPERIYAGSFPFETLEEMVNHLLQQPPVIEHVKRRGPGRAALLYFDEETIELASRLDLTMCFPSLELRRRIDNKVEATRLGDRAGVPSVPNVLGRVTSYEHLRKMAEGLGNDLVIQTPFGDSGMTTFFVSTPAHFEKCKAAVTKEREVKVMKRIKCRAGALEACVTRSGTIVGPLMSELIGYPEITPHAGGWGGNETGPDVFSAETCELAGRYTERLGNELWKIGYRGYFEVDYLVDADTDALYLGEINPRITGATSMTNHSAYAHADVPLFLFHLLEFGEADFDIDVSQINQRWSLPDNIDRWSHMMIKLCGSESLSIGRAPQTGIYRMNDSGEIALVRPQLNRKSVQNESEAFFMRITAPGDVVTVGEDIGMLVTRGRLQTPDHTLTDRGKAWISAIRGSFRWRAMTAPQGT